MFYHIVTQFLDDPVDHYFHSLRKPFIHTQELKINVEVMSL